MRWLKWMWFDFSLKLSTQSIRLNSSLRSFISFSEMKKKLQSLHWERKRSRISRWWRRSWRRSTDTSQLFHTQRHRGDDERQWRLLSKGLISDHDWLIDWLICWWQLYYKKHTVSFRTQNFLVSLKTTYIESSLSKFVDKLWNVPLFRPSNICRWSKAREL